FALGVWVVDVLLSLLLVGNVLLSRQGLLYLANSFAFLLCTLTIAFLIGTLVKNKNAVNGIVNVVALGSSFLCGAFVPVQMLPKSVLWAAHILPSYWYIKTNEYVKKMETVNLETLRPVLDSS
ncbi:MAG: ABC transporter permease, partial [Lachnospiraceae bacterium]|nr:ABC transporter permease [Lachnospiraceae bacterium]